jgi:DNA-binding NtrC family response regulator
VKGAFTGADRDREGKFAAAGRGTLLLDEIDVLSPEHQAKLLRVIETGEFEPVGSNETQHSEARLVVASNYNLEELVRAGRFRTDLYFRLNILNFRLLPLRERPWDIEYLARKFALQHSRTHSIPLRAIEPAFLETLKAYQWPGNIREMENVVRRAVLYCHRGVLTVQDLPSSIRDAVTGMAFSQQAQSQQVAEMHSNLAPHAPLNSGHRLEAAWPGEMEPRSRFHSLPGNTSRLSSAQPPVHEFAGTAVMSSAGASTAMQPASTAVAFANARLAASLEARVDVMERRIIQDSLQRNNQRRKETAAELGISRVTLYNKMKKFGLL